MHKTSTYEALKKYYQLGKTSFDNNPARNNEQGIELIHNYVRKHPLADHRSSSMDATISGPVTRIHQTSYAPFSRLLVHLMQGLPSLHLLVGGRRYTTHCLHQPAVTAQAAVQIICISANKQLKQSFIYSQKGFEIQT